MIFQNKDTIRYSRHPCPIMFTFPESKFLFFTIFLVVALLLAVAASIDPTCTKYTFLSRTLNLPPSPSDYTACTPPFFDILFRFTARVISGPAMKAFLKGSTTPRSGLIFKKGGTEVWPKIQQRCSGRLAQLATYNLSISPGWW